MDYIAQQMFLFFNSQLTKYLTKFLLYSLLYYFIWRNKKMIQGKHTTTKQDLIKGYKLTAAEKRKLKEKQERFDNQRNNRNKHEK